MMILEKRQNVKTMVSLGLTIKEVRRIFFYEGLLMTLMGTILGLFLGTVVVWLQLQFGFIPITPTLPYPVKFELLNILIVFTTIMGLEP